MFDTAMSKNIARLYRAGSMSEAKLDDAVTKGWVTPEEAAALRAEKNPQPATPTS
jgi:hypothetical protein